MLIELSDAQLELLNDLLAYHQNYHNKSGFNNQEVEDIRCYLISACLKQQLALNAKKFNTRDL